MLEKRNSSWELVHKHTPVAMKSDAYVAGVWEVESVDDNGQLSADEPWYDRSMYAMYTKRIWDSSACVEDSEHRSELCKSPHSGRRKEASANACLWAWYFPPK